MGPGWLSVCRGEVPPSQVSACSVGRGWGIAGGGCWVYFMRLGHIDV